MKLAVNCWRLRGERTGVGRYLNNVIGNWSPDVVGDAFDEIVLYSQAPLDWQNLSLPNNLRERVLRSDWPMLAWENLRFGPTANEDVLFCPSFSRPILARGRTVVVVYEATLKLHPGLFPRNRWYSVPQVYLPLIEWSARNATLVLTVTEAARDDIVRAYGVPRSKIRVVPMAPADFLKPLGDRPDVAETAVRYLGSDAPYFLFVGKLTPRRNVPMLMEAFADFKRHGNWPHKLLIVGKNSTQLGLDIHARSLGIQNDMVHAEYVSDQDLNLLYNGAEAFVIPFGYETVSLTMIEAQAVGTPVLTVDVGGLREMTGNAAMYIPRADVDTLSAGLERMAKDSRLRCELSEKGLSYVEQFSWRRAAKETIAVLEEAAQLPL